MRGHAVARLVELRYKPDVAGSIPNGITGIFHWITPFGRTMVLGSTQPLTEMSTRDIFWGVKTASEVGWQTYHLHVPIASKSGSLKLLDLSGPVQACTGVSLHYLKLCDYAAGKSVL